MKTSPCILLLSAALLLLTPCGASGKEPAGVAVAHMTCEYLESPAGLDIRQPRFSWTLEATNSSEYAQAQSAYRIVVSDSADAKRPGGMWDTGWVDSDASQLIRYAGKPLASDRTYYWKVQIRDQRGRTSPWSETRSWTTGLFDPGDWSARWIGSDEVLDTTSKEDCNISDPWLRKRVTLKKRPARAVMFIASVGYHELYVNGQKIGDHILAPAVSDHTLRARYIAYDIAPFLHKGENVVALWLGTSWSIFPSYDIESRPRTPIVLAQADIYYQNPSGTPDLRIATDTSWKVHPSPNKLTGCWRTGSMGGELWDAHRELPEWNTLACDETPWRQATEYTPQLRLSAQTTYPNRTFAEITPADIEQLTDSTYRVDMGVNFTGWTSIRVKARPGKRVEFLFSEREQLPMTFGIRSACIVGPSGEATFRNRFNYSGGRWITIRGASEKPAPADIRGWAVRTDFPRTARFACSDTLQNWIYDRVLWTFQNLSLGGYIVDCSQRERLGYGGDAHATSETGLTNFAMGAFYTKWMEDWRDVQGRRTRKDRPADGDLPHSAPTYGGGGGPAWGGICTTLPWYVYQYESDEQILRDNFPLIENWLAFLASHTRDGLLRRWGGRWDYLADWLWPGATAEGMNNDKPQAECFNSCYYAYNLATAAQIASVIGRDSCAAAWNARADEVRQAVHHAYYDPADHSYCDRSMSNLAAALIGGVPPPELRPVVLKRLEREILEVRKGHIHVGITGGALLFKLLRELGRDNLIYSMTSQTGYPGWGYMKASGATSIWEMWEKDLRGHSLLHSSFLYPGAWYIDGVAGIRTDPEHPGFRRFVIRVPRLEQEHINWAEASVETPAGTVVSSWKQHGGTLSLDATVPPNTVATVLIPDRPGTRIVEPSGHAQPLGTEAGYVRYRVPAGKYAFRQTLDTTARTVRLTTYNVGVFNKYVRNDYPFVADILRETGAETVCLNELDSCTTRTGGIFQLGRIASLMGGWNHRYAAAMPYRGGAYGIGVMTRKKVLDSFTVCLPKANGSEPRALAVLELEDYVIASTHLDYATPEAQLQQIGVITRVMKERYGKSGKPVFLGGDMNATPGSRAIEALKRDWTVLTETCRGTVPSEAPRDCIDYILQLDNGVPCEVVFSGVVNRSAAGDIAKASDHLPVTLEVRLPKKR